MNLHNILILTLIGGFSYIHAMEQPSFGAVKMKPAVPQKGLLAAAAADGSIEVVKKILAEGYDPDTTTKPYFKMHTPLMLAAKHGHLEICKLLIRAGANLDAQVEGRSALELAATKLERGPHLKVCELLVTAHISTPTQAQKTRMYTFLLCLNSVFKNNYSNVRNLFRSKHIPWLIQRENRQKVCKQVNMMVGFSDDLEQSFRVQARDHLRNKFFSKEDLFLEAAQSGDLGVVRSYIASGFDPDGCINENGFTPLGIAIAFNQIEVSQFLLNVGADVFYKTVLLNVGADVFYKTVVPSAVNHRIARRAFIPLEHAFLMYYKGYSHYLAICKIIIQKMIEISPERTQEVLLQLPECEERDRVMDFATELTFGKMKH